MLPYSGLPGFSYPLFFGLLSLLLSFGKGLVFFIPGFFLFLSANLREMISGIDLPWGSAVSFIAVTICTYAMWWAWYGGGFWGPRFFLFLCLPASLFLAVIINNTKTISGYLLAVVVAISVLSTWVGINGFLYGQKNMDICWADNFALESFCWYLPEYSALWRPFVVGFRLDNLHPNHLSVAWQLVVMCILLVKLFCNYTIKIKA